MTLGLFFIPELATLKMNRVYIQVLEREREREEKSKLAHANIESSAVKNKPIVISPFDVKNMQQHRSNL